MKLEGPVKGSYPSVAALLLYPRPHPPEGLFFKPQRSAEKGDTAPVWLRTHSWALQAALALAAGTLYLLQFYVPSSDAPTAFLAGRCSLTLPLDVLDVLASAQKPTLQREEQSFYNRQRGCSPDPRMNLTLGHPERKHYADGSVRVTVISQIPGNGSLCSNSPLALRASQESRVQSFLTPRLPHRGQMGAKGQSGRAGTEALPPRGPALSPAEPGISRLSIC